MTSSKQRMLAVTLYRNLMKWSRDLPPNASLLHLQRTVGGKIVTSPTSLRQSLQVAFRLPLAATHASNRESSFKNRIQDAIEGLSQTGTVNITALPTMLFTSPVTEKSTNHTGGTDSSRDENEVFASGDLQLTPNPRDWANSIQWLPALSEMEDKPFQSDDIPMFPLSGPVIPKDKLQNNAHLPLFSQLSDFPVPGMEIPLRIFEPRYRELYNDVLSNGTKRFVVPMAHPHTPGKYSPYAWLYEIMRVEDVADQTNGKIHLLSHHLVTKVVRIDDIVNPSAYETQVTYLRIQGEILPDKHAKSEDFFLLEKVLREIMNSDSQYSTFGGALLTALAEGNIWSMVSLWLTWIQMQALQIEVKIASKIQIQAEQAKTGVVDDAMVELAQAPHVDDLESLLLEFATLVPLMLQETPKDQCLRMLRQIQYRLIEQDDNETANENDNQL